MDFKRVVIKAAGRTGSHLIAGHLFENMGIVNERGEFLRGTETPVDRLDPLHFEQVLVHDHTRVLPHTSREWDLVISRRRNLVDQAVSAEIANHYNNWGGTPVTDTTPWDIDPATFVPQLINYATYDRYVGNYRQFPWRSVREIFYEDLARDHGYLARTLGGQPVAYDKMPLSNSGQRHSIVQNLKEIHTLGRKTLQDREDEIAAACAGWAREFLNL